MATSYYFSRYERFFCFYQQKDDPKLHDKPVAVVNGAEGTCIITCSYEARQFGIKTGMRLPEARVRCPQLIVVPARSARYASISSCIMEALTSITPDIEIFSVDEAFLDVTHCQNIADPETLGRLAQQKVLEASGLPCSIGISGDKTTAKWAADLHKPNGFCVIPPWESKARLCTVPVNALCGIGPGISRFLARYGVSTCGDMEKLPISILGKRFGNLGRRIWLMCQGADPEPVHTQVHSPKSMGHGKIMPPNTREKKTILLYLQHLCEKLAARLRQHQLKTQHLFIGWRSWENGWLGQKIALSYPMADGAIFFKQGSAILNEVWSGQALYQVQVTALDPQAGYVQGDLFTTTNSAEKLHQIIDAINAKYGALTITPAPLVQHATTHCVISPAWRPTGHRQSL
jgi:DNA polymerase-4